MRMEIFSLLPFMSMILSLLVKLMKKLQKSKKASLNGFKRKIWGELKYILGLQVIQENGKVWIGQPTYTESILKTFGTENCKTLETPVELGFKPC